MSLNVIASPMQGIRGVFDLMPTDTAEQWAVIATRLAQGADGRSSSTSSRSRAAAARGNVSPRRQVEACIGQCEELTADDGYFATLLPVRPRRRRQPLAARASPRTWPRPVAAASGAYADLGRTLRREILPQAPEADACGRERYRCVSRSFLGATRRPRGDLRLGPGRSSARITAEMEAVAEQIKPGATVKEAIDLLDADPAYQLHGTDALQRVDAGARPTRPSPSLAGSHFDIPEPVRTIECRIAPTTSPAASTTPARARTSAARAACGGRCPRASRSSAPGAS